MAESVAEITQALAEAQPEDNILVLGSGAVVRPKALPMLLLQRLTDQHPAPEPPLIHVGLEQGGGREWDEPNPNDPTYLAALSKHNRESGQLFLNLILLRGVEIIKMPEKVPSLEDPSWAEELELLGQAVPEAGAMRRLLWMMSFLLSGTEDLVRLQSMVLKASGVTEEAIAAAMESFRPSAG